MILNLAFLLLRIYPLIYYWYIVLLEASRIFIFFTNNNNIFLQYQYRYEKVYEIKVEYNPQEWSRLSPCLRPVQVLSGLLAVYKLKWYFRPAATHNKCVYTHMTIDTIDLPLYERRVMINSLLHNIVHFYTSFSVLNAYL